MRLGFGLHALLTRPSFRAVFGAFGIGFEEGCDLWRKPLV